MTYTTHDTENAPSTFIARDGNTAPVYVDIAWFYRWVPGESMKAGAIIRDGKTLYGPCEVRRADSVGTR